MQSLFILPITYFIIRLLYPYNMSYIRLSYDETALLEFYGSKLKIKTHFTTNKPTHPLPHFFLHPHLLFLQTLNTASFPLPHGSVAAGSCPPSTVHGAAAPPWPPLQSPLPHLFVFGLLKNQVRVSDLGKISELKFKIES